MAQALLSKLDSTVAVTRPLWGWLGQVALVVLGTHLAADRMDDDLANLLTQLPLPWGDPQDPFTVGTWMAIGIELAVTLWALFALGKTSDDRISGPKEWFRRASVHSLVAPLFWLPVSLVGCWTIAMAVEDLLGFQGSRYIGYAVGALVLWRLCLTGLWNLTAYPHEPKRRTEGILFASPLIVVAGYAAAYGLPVWGWM